MPRLHDLYIKGKIKEIFEILKQQKSNANAHAPDINSGKLERKRAAVSTDQKNERGETLLHLLIKDSKLIEFNKFLMLGESSDINARTRLGIRPIHYAILTNSQNNVMLVVEQGASILNTKDGIAGLVAFARKAKASPEMINYLSSDNFSKLVNLYAAKAEKISLISSRKEEEKRQKHNLIRGLKEISACFVTSQETAASTLETVLQEEELPANQLAASSTLDKPEASSANTQSIAQDNILSQATRSSANNEARPKFKSALNVYQNQLRMVDDSQSMNRGESSSSAVLSRSAAQLRRPLSQISSERILASRQNANSNLREVIDLTREADMNEEFYMISSSQSTLGEGSGHNKLTFDGEKENFIGERRSRSPSVNSNGSTSHEGSASDSDLSSKTPDRKPKKQDQKATPGREDLVQNFPVNSWVHKVTQFPLSPIKDFSFGR